jgi:hypothetical protein
MRRPVHVRCLPDFADYYKYGTGPYTLPQTVYKYAAIATDILINIKAIAPGLQLSTAAPAVGKQQL